MVRRCLALLIAIAVVVALPSFGGGAPTPHVMAAKAECACPDAAEDCGGPGMPGCQGALACAVQCGTATPMLGVEPGALASGQTVAVHRMPPAAPLASTAAAPPYRPPTASIPA